MPGALAKLQKALAARLHGSLLSLQLQEKHIGISLTGRPNVNSVRCTSFTPAVATNPCHEPCSGRSRFLRAVFWPARTRSKFSPCLDLLRLLSSHCGESFGPQRCSAPAWGIAFGNSVSFVLTTRPGLQKFKPYVEACLFGLEVDTADPVLLLNGVCLPQQSSSTICYLQELKDFRAARRSASKVCQHGRL